MAEQQMGGRYAWSSSIERWDEVDTESHIFLYCNKTDDDTFKNVHVEEHIRWVTRVPLSMAKWARLVKCRIYELTEPRHVLGEPSAKCTILRLSAQKNLEEG
ncbi:hypothetical protein GmHk_U059453 [Glycine max]|nr:hypothetical protein GmHk_U059453 [Glycine max]